MSAMSRTRLENINAVYNSKLDQCRHIAELIYDMPQCSAYLYGSSDSSIDNITLTNMLNPILEADETVNSLFFFRGDTVIYDLDRYYVDMPTKQALLQKIMTTQTDYYPLCMPAKNGGNKIVLFRTSRTMLFGKSQNGVALILDQTVFTRGILSSYENSKESIFIIDNRTKTILISQDGLHILNMIPDWEKTFSNEYFSSTTRQKNDISYYVNRINDEDSGFSIVSVIDYQSSLAELSHTRNLMIVFGILTVLLALLLAHFFTNRVYRPIYSVFDSIRTAFSPAENPDDRYDEIQSISHVISQTASKMSLLESRHANVELIEYFNGKHDSIPTPNMIEKIEKELGDCRYCVIIMEFRVGPSEHSSAVELSKLNFSEITASTFRNLSGEKNINVKCGVFPLSFDQIVLVASAGHESEFWGNKELLKEFCEELSGRISSEYPINVAMGVSQCSDSFASLKDRYEQAQKLLRNKLFCNGNSCFVFEDCAAGKFNEETASNIERKIMAIIKCGEYSCVPQPYIDRLIASVAGSRYDESVKFLVKFLIDAERLSKNISEHGNAQQGDYLDIYTKIHSCSCLDELKSLLQNVLNTACMELKIACSKTVQDNIIEALSYIDNHIGDKSLSIDSLAEQFRISSSYFSKLFNSYTKTTFPDYINGLRLQKAAELLRASDKDISEISNLVGFNSNSYFSSAFKKKFGISPSKYRMNFTGHET